MIYNFIIVLRITCYEALHVVVMDASAARENKYDTYA